MAYDKTKDPYGEIPGTSITGAARRIEVITPNDAGPATYWKQLWVFVPPDVAGGVATINVIGVGNDDADIVPLKATPGLQPLPAAQIRCVRATGTTAGLTIYGLRDK